MLEYFTSIWDSFINWLVPVAYASGGEAASGANANPSLLSVDVRTVLFVIINLILLIWLLRRFLYKPVQNMLAERRAAATKVIDEAKALQAQAEEKLAQMDVEKKQATEEARKVTSEAVTMADSIKEEILKKARDEAKSIVRAAEEEAKGEREMTAEDIKERSKTVIEAVTNKVVLDVFDKNTVEYYTDHIIEDLPRLTACDIKDNKVDLCDVIRSAKSVEKVVVETAVELSKEQKDKVKSFVFDLIDGHPKIEFSIESELISGLRMMLDDTLFDASVQRMVKHTVSSLR